MPLETATYINALVSTNPASSDGMNGADDHMRLIKATLKNTFPNITGPLGASQATIDSTVASVAAASARNGDVPPGAIMDFGTPNPPAGWLTCDGQAVSRTTYAALFNEIGGYWGSGDGSTTFNLPPLINRFRRHRDNSTTAGGVGNLQGDQNKSHYHNVAGNTGGLNNSIDHLHTGTTASMNRNNVHNHSYTAPALNSSTTGGGSFGIVGAGTGQVTSTADTNHEHTFTTNGSDRSLDHSHPININSGGGSADGAEARPLSATVLTCIKY